MPLDSLKKARLDYNWHHPRVVLAEDIIPQITEVEGEDHRFTRLLQIQLVAWHDFVVLDAQPPRILQGGKRFVCGPPVNLGEFRTLFYDMS